MQRTIGFGFNVKEFHFGVDRIAYSISDVEPNGPAARAGIKWVADSVAIFDMSQTLLWEDWTCLTVKYFRENDVVISAGRDSLVGSIEDKEFRGKAILWALYVPRNLMSHQHSINLMVKREGECWVVGWLPRQFYLIDFNNLFIIKVLLMRPGTSPRSEQYCQVKKWANKM